MIDFATAQARVLALGDAVAVETVALASAAGRWAAADIVARRTQPACALSSMDGYAVRFADMPGPWQVIGTSAAGAGFTGAVGAGQAVRIFTGAAVPEHADTVLVQEDATRDGAHLTLSGEGPGGRGASIRAAGSDFTVEQVLLAAGARLMPAAIALAAAGGHGTLTVRRRLRIALLATGDELVAAGGPCPDDRLPDANTPMLAAFLGDLPVDIVDLGIVLDDRTALAAAIDRARDVDILVTSGGASVGDYDLVRPALLAAGAVLDFWKVAMRPGKPLMAGRLGNGVVLGLPGNPVSAFVTATLFLRPLVAQLLGARDPLPSRVSAIVAAPLPEVGARTDFVRANWALGKLAPLPSHDSGALLPLANAEALIVRPASSQAVAAGAVVEAILIA